MTDSTPILDLDGFLDRLGGDREMGLEILGMFFDDADTYQADTRTALDAEDLNRAAQLAHTLKGSAANVGAMSVSACAAELERQAKQGATTSARATLAELRQRLSECRAHVQRIIP